MTRVQPLHDRVLVKRLVTDDKTPGGIYIPDTAKEKPQKGEVVAVGKGQVQNSGTVRPLEVKQGDKILFSKYAGVEFETDGQEYLILKEEDILGTLNNK